MILGLLSTALSGGLVGIFGSLFTNILTFFNQRQKNKHDLSLREMDLKEISANKEFMLAEAQANIQITKTQVEGAVELQESVAFTESQKSAMTSLFKPSYMDRLMEKGGWWNNLVCSIIAFLFGTVDFIKHILRPGMTVFISIIFALICMESWEILSQGGYEWTMDKAVAIITMMVDAVVYLTLMVWGWWFSDRRIAKAAFRLNDGNIK